MEGQDIDGGQGHQRRSRRLELVIAFIMSKAAKAANHVGGGNLGMVGTLALVKLKAAKAANDGMLGNLRTEVDYGPA